MPFNVPQLLMWVVTHCLMHIKYVMQTSAWANPKTASRRCKSALLQQRQQLTSQILASQQSTASADAAHQDALLSVPNCNNSSEMTSSVKSYLHFKSIYPQYALQWQTLRTHSLFNAWIQKPEGLESFCCA